MKLMENSNTASRPIRTLSDSGGLFLASDMSTSLKEQISAPVAVIFEVSHFPIDDHRKRAIGPWHRKFAHDRGAHRPSPMGWEAYDGLRNTSLSVRERCWCQGVSYSLRQDRVADPVH